MRLGPVRELSREAQAILTRAGVKVDPAHTERACRRWRAWSRPQGVPLGYLFAHFLRLERETVAELDALGARFAGGGRANG